MNILPNAYTRMLLLLKQWQLRTEEQNKMAEMKRMMKVEYLGVAEAESMTGVSRWTWRRWAYDGKVASVKLGKRLVIPTSEIERLVAENTRPSLPVSTSRRKVSESEFQEVIQEGSKSASANRRKREG